MSICNSSNIISICKLFVTYNALNKKSTIFIKKNEESQYYLKTYVVM